MEVSTQADDYRIVTEHDERIRSGLAFRRCRGELTEQKGNKVQQRNGESEGPWSGIEIGGLIMFRYILGLLTLDLGAAACTQTSTPTAIPTATAAPVSTPTLGVALTPTATPTPAAAPTLVPAEEARDQGVSQQRGL